MRKKMHEKDASSGNIVQIDEETKEQRKNAVAMKNIQEKEDEKLLHEKETSSYDDVQLEEETNEQTMQKTDDNNDNETRKEHKQNEEREKDIQSKSPGKVVIEITESEAPDKAQTVNIEVGKDENMKEKDENTEVVHKRSATKDVEKCSVETLETVGEKAKEVEGEQIHKNVKSTDVVVEAKRTEEVQKSGNEVYNADETSMEKLHCKKCDIIFLNISNSRNHVATVHTANFKCKFCVHTFHDIHVLQDHIATTHSTIPCIYILLECV